jgi:hypothetical protein
VRNSTFLYGRDPYQQQIHGKSMNVIMNVWTKKEKRNKKIGNCHQPFIITHPDLIVVVCHYEII